MKIYTPDFEYLKGQKALENLKGIEGAQIRHYVQVNKYFIKKLEDELKEMQEIFNGIKKYTQ